MPLGVSSKLLSYQSILNEESLSTAPHKTKLHTDCLAAMMWQGGSQNLDPPVPQGSGAQRVLFWHLWALPQTIATTRNSDGTLHYFRERMPPVT